MRSTSENKQPDNAEATQEQALQIVRDVLQQESDAILSVAASLGEAITGAIQLLKNCRGRVIVTGMGKMGCIARKATATFSSTGTPAVFLHPAEAIHGDIGVVTPEDVVLALSNSGETSEVLALLPYMHRFSVPVIAITGNEHSALASRSTCTIDICVEKEADPDSLAPTSSTTVALAMCDALAIVLMRDRGFTPEQFAIFHPGGSLGRRLLLTVSDMMQTGDALPVVRSDESLQSAILVISEKRLGAALVLDEAGLMNGILTDGDLRRAFQANADPSTMKVVQAMTHNPVFVSAGDLAAAALKIMQDKSITVLPVVAVDDEAIDAEDEAINIEAGIAATTPDTDDNAGSGPRPVGIIHLHDLLRSGIA